MTHQTSQSCPPRANRLLSALPETDYQRLLPHLQPVLLHDGQVLFNRNTPGHGVYFPTSGVVCAVLSSGDEMEVEVVPIGHEGMVGRAACVLGDTPTFRRAVVEVGGSAWWLPIDVLRAEVERRAALCDLLHDYLEVLLIEAGLMALCKSRHALPARLSHWLLLLREQVQADELPFSQELIADLMAARPAEVTLAAGLLWKKALIRFNHNHLTVLDHTGLQAQACPCAALIHEERDRLFSRTKIDRAA